MDTPDRFAHPLLWTARITSTLLLAFLLFMLIGHLVGDANGPNGMTFTSPTDVLAFVLFPVLPIVGLALAYRWEFLGGTVVVASMAALFILRPDLLRLSFLALSLPALLYMLGGWLRMRRSKVADA